MQGARVASAMAAANPDRALACIFFSYPLHTPGDQVPQHSGVIICHACLQQVCTLATLSCGALQDNLRDVPLVDLTLPIMFVHGSKDTMCEAGTFQAVRGRMSSSDLQVHDLHGLSHLTPLLIPQPLTGQHMTG